MLLAMDIGNTNVVFGLYDGEKWVGQWRLKTDAEDGLDDCAVKIGSLIGLAGFSLSQIKRFGLSSVVPPLTAVFVAFARKYLRTEPVVVGPESAGIGLGYDNPKQLGADRIANAVAAHARFGRPVLVVDFGTATKFDYVDAAGNFVGGAIAPGLMVTSQALFRRTAQLPMVDVFRKVERLVARDTVSAMTVGLFHGYLSLVEGLIKKIKAEVGTDPLVLATGGLAPLMAEYGLFDAIDPNLTLDGIRLILERNLEAKA